MTSRWAPWVDRRTGRTIKSGLSPQSRSYVPPNKLLGNYRAIVLKTYATDAPERTEGSRSGSKRVFEIECDVVLAKSMVHYSRVPVMQREHGVADANLWIPRPTTTAIGNLILGEPSLTRVSRRGTPEFPPPSNPEMWDGDQVIVEFVEGDPEKPIITGASSHTSTKRLVVAGSGWSESDFGSTRGKPHLNEKYVRYRGVELRINNDGDVLLDTVGATTDQSAEVPNPLAGGHVRVRLKAGRRFTIQIEGLPPGSGDAVEVYRDPLTQLVQIDLVEGATQAYMRGTAHAAAFQAFLAATQVFAETAARAADAGATAAVAVLAPLKPAFIALAAAFGAWGGISPPPLLNVPPVPPLPPPPVAPIGVFSATLVPGAALSTQIRGE